MKKLLLLDVDGVFNVKNTVQPGCKEPAGMDERVPDLAVFRVPLLSFPTNFSVQASPKVVSHVGSLLPHVEPLWFTSWFQDTENLNKQFGFDFGFLGNADLLEDDRWWKLEFLQTHFLDREIIWVDDEFPTFPEVQKWVESQSGRVTLVPTRPTVGINTQTLDLLDDLIMS